MSKLSLCDRGWRTRARLTLAIGIGIYGFVFFRDGEWVYSIVDDKLYLTSPNWDSVSDARLLSARK